MCAAEEGCADLPDAGWVDVEPDLGGAPQEVCGDGVVQEALGEQCDDGGVEGGDGCDAWCLEERCGNAALQPLLGEACDDGNTDDGDGCSAACVVEFCGDGVVQEELGEACDDGSAEDEDGCSAACAVEFCGDGVVQEGLDERCDDGNTDDEDGCSAACVVEFCGDGVTQEGLGEGCDDGNMEDDDGCSGGCAVEFCGDGVRQASEACDPGESPTTCTEDCRTCSPLDEDEDGFSGCMGDCDDGDPSRSPERREDRHNGVDDNCDGATDEPLTWPAPAATAPLDYVGEGGAPGDLFPELVFSDQFGRPYSVLERGYGAMVLVDIGATWCPPCRDAAAEAQETADRLAERPYASVYIQALAQGGEEGVLATEEEAAEWERRFDLDIPVIWGAIEQSLPPLEAWPTFYVLDPEHRVRAVILGLPSQESLIQAVDEAHEEWLAEP